MASSADTFTLPLLVYNTGLSASGPIACAHRFATRIGRRTRRVICAKVRWMDICGRSKDWYQQWYFTDDFANRQIAGIEARLIKSSLRFALRIWRWQRHAWCGWLATRYLARGARVDFVMPNSWVYCSGLGDGRVKRNCGFVVDGRRLGRFLRGPRRRVR